MKTRIYATPAVEGLKQINLEPVQDFYVYRYNDFREKNV